MKKIIINSVLCFSILLIGNVVNAQINPVASFNFDNCLVQDQSGNYQDGQIMDNLDCDCGVGDSSNAMYFSGTPDSIILDPALKDLFIGDFSLSFYFWVDDAPMNYPILSISGLCPDIRDSAFIVKYLPVTSELIVEFSKSPLDGVFMRTDLEMQSCWHHFLFTREGSLFTLFLDGKFVENFKFVNPIILGENHDITIGSSECVGFSDTYFNGRIDEFKLFDRAVNMEDEIRQLFVFPDEIISRDTTLFLGDSYDIITGTSCAPLISWTPTIGVDDPSDPNTRITPLQTTSYTLDFDHGACISTDTVRITVITEDQIECSNILLPTAFTPNSDGINDRFFISNAFIIESLSRFEIYDRWGLKLFETTNKNDSWNGTYNNDIMPPGTYVYKVEYSCLGEDLRKTGSFNILR